MKLDELVLAIFGYSMCGLLSVVLAALIGEMYEEHATDRTSPHFRALAVFLLWPLFFPWLTGKVAVWFSLRGR